MVLIVCRGTRPVQCITSYGGQLCEARMRSKADRGIGSIEEGGRGREGPGTVACVSL